MTSTKVSKQLLHCGAQGEPLYLNAFDLYASHVGVPTILFFAQTIDADAMACALRDMGVVFPFVFGRIKRDADKKQYIAQNDAGIEYIVHQHDEALGEASVEKPLGKKLQTLFTMTMPWQVVDKPAPLLRFELHTYSDGKSAFVFNSVHSLFDGTGKWQLIRTLSELYQRYVSCDKERSDTKVWPQQELLSKRREFNFARDYFYTASEIKNADDFTASYVRPYSLLKRVFIYSRIVKNIIWPPSSISLHIPVAAIQRFKDKVNSAEQYVSTQDIIIALCLKSLGLKRAMTLLNLRHNSALNIPQNYIGNCIDYNDIHFTHDDIHSSALSDIALKVRKQARAKQDLESCSYAKMLEAYRQKNNLGGLFIEGVEASLNDGVLFNNYSRFASYDLAFPAKSQSAATNANKAIWYELPAGPFRMLTVCDTALQDGSVDCHFTGKKQEVAALRDALAHFCK